MGVGVIRCSVAGVLALFALMAIRPATAAAGAAVSVIPSAPSNVSVGQSVPASLTVQNTSFDGPGETGFATDQFQLNDLTLVPSCGSQVVAADCPVGVRDPGVIVPSPLTGIGRTGTACAGRTFTIGDIDAAQGKYRFTPDAAVILGAANGPLAVRSCTIDFSLNVPRTPTLDASPSPGLQTGTKAFAQTTDVTPPHNGFVGGGVGTSETTVAQNTPTITTTASPGVGLGSGTLNDSATVGGLVNPVQGAGGGTVEFRLYGPNDATCATAIFTSSNRPLTLNGANTQGTATSASFTPTAAGVYRWRAFYSGDVNNAPVSGPCNAANESVEVTPATPTIVTAASPNITLGAGTLIDTATVDGLVNPIGGPFAGTVEFRLYGPNDATCATAIFTSTNRPIALDGTATSAGFTPVDAGVYRWRAFYSGDANNGAVDGPCNAPNESAVVHPATPTLTTHASPGITLGSGALTDTATVGGRVNPLDGATVDFELYGPDDATCAGAPVSTSTVDYPVGGGAVSSDPYIPTAPGVYRWIASYSGDANNSAVSGSCGDADEDVTVAALTPTPTPTVTATATSTASPTPTATRTPTPTPTVTATVTPTPTATPTVTCAGRTATLVAVPGQKRIRGTSRADVIAGGNAAENINGRAGQDAICAGGGADTVRGGPGKDRIKGSRGRDRIQTVDGGRDVVDCGPGRDRLRADKRDAAKRCERVIRVP